MLGVFLLLSTLWKSLSTYSKLSAPLNNTVLDAVLSLLLDLVMINMIRIFVKAAAIFTLQRAIRNRGIHLNALLLPIGLTLILAAGFATTLHVQRLLLYLMPPQLGIAYNFFLHQVEVVFCILLDYAFFWFLFTAVSSMVYRVVLHESIISTVKRCIQRSIVNRFEQTSGCLATRSIHDIISLANVSVFNRICVLLACCMLPPRDGLSPSAPTQKLAQDIFGAKINGNGHTFAFPIRYEGRTNGNPLFGQIPRSDRNPRSGGNPGSSNVEDSTDPDISAPSSSASNSSGDDGPIFGEQSFYNGNPGPIIHHSGGMFGGNGPTNTHVSGFLGGNVPTYNSGGGMFGINRTTNNRGGGLFGSSGLNINYGGGLFGGNGPNINYDDNRPFGSNNPNKSRSSRYSDGNGSNNSHGGGIFGDNGPTTTYHNSPFGGNSSSNTHRNVPLSGDGSVNNHGGGALRAGSLHGGSSGLANRPGGGLFGVNTSQDGAPAPVKDSGDNRPFFGGNSSCDNDSYPTQSSGNGIRPVFGGNPVLRNSLRGSLFDVTRPTDNEKL